MDSSRRLRILVRYQQILAERRRVSAELQRLQAQQEQIDKKLCEIDEVCQREEEMDETLISFDVPYQIMPDTVYSLRSDSLVPICRVTGEELLEAQATFRIVTLPNSKGYTMEAKE